MHSTSDERLRLVRRAELVAWGTVRSGLALTCIGSILGVISLFVLVAVLLSVDVPLQGELALPVLILMYSLLGIVAGTVLAVTGACMSCAAPSVSEAKGWGIGSCIFALLTLVLLGVVVLMALNVVDQGKKKDETRFGGAGPAKKAPFSPQEARVIGYSVQGTNLLGVSCYLLFLRAIASYVRREGLAVGILVYLIVYVLFTLGLIALTSLGQSRAVDVNQVQVIAWMIGGGFVLLTVWGILLVAMVRDALTKQMLAG